MECELTHEPSDTHVVVDLDEGEAVLAEPGGIKSTLVTGEGLVFEFTGSGTVWYQTRGLNAFASSIADVLAGGDSGGGNSGDGVGVDDFF